MAINIYLLNRTYIAQDSTTGLTAYGHSEQVATDTLTKMLEKYWDKKKIVVPIQTQESTPPKTK